MKLCCVECSNRSLINGDALKERLWSVSQTSVDYWSTYWGILQSSCSGLTEVSWASRSVLMPQTSEQTQLSGREDEKGRNWSKGEGGGKKRCQICTKKGKKVDWRLDSRQQRQTPSKAFTLFMIKSIMPIQTVSPQIFEPSGSVSSWNLKNK